MDLSRQLQRIPGSSASNDVPGDCLRAAVASLLELPYEDVPHFAASPHWWHEMCTWARAAVGKDFTVLVPSSGTVRQLVDAGTEAVIGVGPSPRGAWDHAVLVSPDDLRLIHDPHPDQAGVKYVAFVIALTSPEKT